MFPFDFSAFIVNQISVLLSYELFTYVVVRGDRRKHFIIKDNHSRLETAW